MNKISFTIKFLLRHLNNSHKLFVRITVNRKSAEIYLQRIIDPLKWDKDKQLVKGNNESSQSLNHYIEVIRYKLISIHDVLIKNDEDYNAKKVKNIFLGKNFINHYLINEFYNHNEKVKVLSETSNKYAPATYLRYNTTLKHIKDFLNHNGKDDIAFTDITSQWLNDLDYYLRTEKKLSNNTTLKYIKLFKKIYKIALRNGWATKDPFIGFKVKFEPVKREFLSIEELRLISSKELYLERLDQVRDIFLFCCFTGLRYSDVKQLVNDDIHTNSNGTKSIFKKTQKSKSIVRILILPDAEKILDKYRDSIYCKVKEVCLPVISNQKTNAYLKEIAVLCGIEKDLTFHMARHTFATLALEFGITIETVKEILGHSDLTTTQIYAKITNNKVMAEMTRFKF